MEKPQAAHTSTTYQAARKATYGVQKGLPVETARFVSSCFIQPLYLTNLSPSRLGATHLIRLESESERTESRDRNGHPSFGCIADAEDVRSRVVPSPSVSPTAKALPVYLSLVVMILPTPVTSSRVTYPLVIDSVLGPRNFNQGRLFLKQVAFSVSTGEYSVERGIRWRTNFCYERNSHMNIGDFSDCG
jgi:hypothetical protein